MEEENDNETPTNPTKKYGSTTTATAETSFNGNGESNVSMKIFAKYLFCKLICANNSSLKMHKGITRCYFNLSDFVTGRE